MPDRPARWRAAVALTAVMTGLLTLTSTAAPALDAPRPDSRPDRGAAVSPRAAQRAVAAVGRAQAIADGSGPGDLTMALREVANTRDSLTGSDRAAADALLRRPPGATGDGTLSYGATPEEKPFCSPDICVHYVASGPNSPSMDSTRLDQVPDYVALALKTLTHVHNVYLAAGYREPLPDGTLGGNAKIDVYLGELGTRGLYGYCTSDDPSRSTDHYDRWAYCALDNDYSAEEFGSAHTPTENLQVTVAHEYFHATQFAYDRYEDSWLLEATATWAEDEVYDDVNDNLQYLASSQLTRPRTPLDTFDYGTGFHYGTWSFIRFLTERYPARVGSLPRLVLDVFRKADGARGAPDQYSWQAIGSVLRAKKTTGAAMLGRYAVANRRPAQRYDEGRVNRYPVAPLAERAVVAPRRSFRADVTLNHLSTATLRLTPERTGAAAWRLKLALDLPPTLRGSSVVITRASTAGGVSTSTVRLDRQGDAVKRVPFSSASTAWVEVTLVNGSGRFRCFVGGSFSCQGKPLDNAQRMRFTASAVR